MVSVVIVNYNTFELTCKCIQSVIQYTKEVSFEVVLVDNASVEVQPHSFEHVFGDKIKFVQSEVNLGFAGGNNLGVAASQGEYILLLNSDTELFEDSISMTLQYMLKQQNLGATSCKLLNPDRVTTQNAAHAFFSLKKHLLETTGLSAIFKVSYAKVKTVYNMNQTGPCGWIWGTFFFFPRKNLQFMNGKLTENFFMYSEDVEWSYLFHINGLQNYYFAGTAIIHHIGKSNNPTLRKQNIRTSHLKFLRMYHGPLVAFTEGVLLKTDDLLRYIKRKRKGLKYKVSRIIK